MAAAHRNMEGLARGTRMLRTAPGSAIGSNRVENLIRPIPLNRKNALFAGQGNGGIAWARSHPSSKPAKPTT